MGQCASSKTHKQKDYQQLPADIGKFQSHLSNNKRLNFQATLSNIRILDLPISSVSLQFRIPGIFTFALPRKLKKSQQSSSTEIKWTVNQNFNFETDELAIRKAFLNIQAFDQQLNKIQDLNINLYHIITGPSHFDLGVKVKNQSSRLIFDLKISQIVDLQIKPSAIETQLNIISEDPRMFNFSFFILKRKGFQSYEASQIQEKLTIQGKIQNNQKTQKNKLQIQNMEPQTPTRKNKKRIENDQKQKNIKEIVCWERKTFPQMPSFQIVMNYSDLSKSQLKMILWEFKDQHFQSDHDEYVYITECYIPINLFLQAQGVINMKTEKQQNCVQYKEKLLYNGKSLGNIRFVFNCSYKSSYKQMKACTRTENGIIDMTPIFDRYIADKSKPDETIEKINQLTMKINKKNFELNNEEASFQRNGRLLKAQIVSHFDSLIQLLQKTYCNSTIMLNENSKNNILKSQDRLLNIIQTLTIFIEVDDVHFSSYSWKTIVMIIKRGEFFLYYMGYSQEEVALIQDQRIDTQLKQRLNISVKYYQTLVKLLNYALIFTPSGYNKETKKYVQMLKAFCFIRLPIFRQEVLKHIAREKDDEQIDYFPSQFCSMISLVNQNKEQSKYLFLHQLDWQKRFFNVLNHQKNTIRIEVELKDNLKNRAWFQKIQKRQEQYFYFIQYLSLKFQQLSKKSKFSKWHYLPGYSKVIRGFLSEMKNKKLVQYSNSLIIASNYILINHKLMNHILNILFNKTSCYQSDDVMKVLSLLSSQFQYLTLSSPHLPQTFNYLTFFQGLKMIIQQGTVPCIIHAMLLIYDYYEKFSIQFRINLMKYLLGKVFFKLFLHWSYQVRNIFHYLIVIKIDQQISSLKQNLHQINEISDRYKQIVNILKQAQSKTQNHQKKCKNSEKQLYKMMKKKLAQKKKKIHNNSSHKKIEHDQIKQPSQASIRRRSGTISFSQSSHKSNESQKINTNQRKQLTSGVEIPLRLTFSQKKNNFQCRKSRQLSSNNSSCGQPECDENTTITRKKRFSFCGSLDYEIKQIDENEFSYLSDALNEYREINTFIKKQIELKGMLPPIKLKCNINLNEGNGKWCQIDKLVKD